MTAHRTLDRARLETLMASELAAFERAFFGTIHSFCLLLAQRYGQALGLNLNPAVIEGADMEEALWEEFLEQDAAGVAGHAVLGLHDLCDS